MIDDREIWACALAVERRYQDGASAHIAERIRELAIAGDTQGVATWRRIAVALDQLRSAPDAVDRI